MYCYYCGGEVPDGSAFCTNCGAKLDNASSATPQAYGQPPKKKKLKTWMFIVGGAVLLLAIAAVLVFAVFGVGKSGGPFSGNTTQTKFANDVVAVFTGAFSDMGAVDTQRMLKDPFDVEMKISADQDGSSQDVTLAAIYDQQKLGVSVESDNSTAVLLLDGDTIYASSDGYVSGLRFDTDADLSKNMTLKDRAAALLKSAGDYDIDYQKLAEMLLNSISEDCFEKNGDTITLTLTMDDIVNTLNTFSDKLEDDKELSDELSDMIGDIAGTSMDVSDLISMASSYLKAQADSSDMTFTWEVRYDGGTPANMKVSYDDGSDYGSFDLSFGYEKTKDGKDITLKETAGGTETKGELSVSKNGSKTEYDGTFKTTYDGKVYSSYDIQGYVQVKGQDVEGSFEATDAEGAKTSLDYNGTVAFGMPKDKVEKDDRFDVDTSDANVTDFSDIFGGGSIGGLSNYGDLGSGLGLGDTDWGVEASTMPSATVVTESGVIGLILPTEGSSYYDALASAISSEAESYGWRVSAFPSDRAGGEQEALETLISTGAMAAIIDPQGLDEGAVQDLESMCQQSGVACVMLFDEGESASGNVGSVTLDLAYTGADLAYYAGYYYNATGAYIIAGDEYGGDTNALLQSLFDDSNYGLNSTSAVVNGIDYAPNADAAATSAANALISFPSVDTIICIEPDYAMAVLNALDSAGFSGNLVCYAREDTVNALSASSYTPNVSCEYFLTKDIARYCISEVSSQLSGYSPQAYTIDSYSW